MKFPELIIENFLAITEAKISLADRGLVLIQGVNHDDSSANSNGSGKSSLADALCWCWFGTTARGVTGDEVINHSAGKNTRVVSTVVDGSITYTATRHRKHKAGKNSLTITAFDGLKLTDLTKGTDKLTQEVANKIIGSSLEVFCGSIYAGQERMPDLPAMTDKNLKVLIEEAAGVTVLEGAYRQAREDHNAANAAVTDANAKVLGFQREKLWIEGQIIDTEAASVTWEREKIARAEVIKQEITAIIPLLKDYDAKLAALDIPALQSEIANLDKRIGSVDGEQAQLTILERELAQAIAATNSALDAETISKEQVSHANAELTNINHKIGCPCGECGRPLTGSELASATAAAQSRLDAQQAILNKANAAVEQATKAFVSASSARDSFKLSMTDISAAAAQRASLQAQLTSAQTLKHEREITATRAKSLRDQMTTIAAETPPYGPQLTKLRDDLSKVEQRIDLMEKALSDLTDRLLVEAEVVKIYGPAGVRAHILDEVTPFLNIQTTKYLATLSDGNIDATWTTLTPNAKGELKEKFSIDVTNATGGKTFHSLSGGEKRKVRVATALALQDLVATRASKPIDLFIGDEIDDALDPAGLERLTMILEDKAKERGSVFVISHNELSDFIRNIVTVEKKSGITSITETIV